MSFSVYYDKQPSIFLKKLDKPLAKLIMDNIEEKLKINPVPSNVKVIVGEHGVFRLRIGSHYRALYRVDYSNKRIIVFKLNKRSKIY